MPISLNLQLKHDLQWRLFPIIESSRYVQRCQKVVAEINSDCQHHQRRFFDVCAGHDSLIIRQFDDDFRAECFLTFHRHVLFSDASGQSLGSVCFRTFMKEDGRILIRPYSLHSTKLACAPVTPKTF